VIIFYTGALAGFIGTVVLGPRYGRYMKASEVTKMKAALSRNESPLPQMLSDLSEAIEVDELFLRKVRKLIHKETSEDDFYHVDVPLMVFGTILTIIGWAMLNAAGGGSHSLNSVTLRHQADTAYINTFLSGCTSAFFSFLLKRYIVYGDNDKTPRYDIRSLCNGFLAGAAAVAAGSGIMNPWSAVIVGFF
jgi:ammonia channel protein AmtB